MHSAVENRGTVFNTRSAILMARLVDASGAPIRREDVCEIEYSIYELDPCWPNLRTVVAGHHDVALDVDEIMFDSLKVGNSWTVDCIGYNFRHEIWPARARAFPKAGVDYELQYRFSSSCGQRIIVRFQIRC